MMTQVRFVKGMKGIQYILIRKTGQPPFAT